MGHELEMEMQRGNAIRVWSRVKER